MKNTKKEMAHQEVQDLLELMQPGEFIKLNEIVHYDKFKCTGYYDQLKMSFLKKAQEDKKILIGKKNILPSGVAKDNLHGNATIVIKK